MTLCCEFFKKKCTTFLCVSDILLWIFHNEVSHFSLCKSSLSLPFHVFPDPILTSNVFNISGTARQNFCWRSCSIFLCLVFMGKENTKSCISKKKKIPLIKKVTITYFEIEPFPLANYKQNSVVLHVHFEFIGSGH